MMGRDRNDSEVGDRGQDLDSMLLKVSNTQLGFPRYCKNSILILPIAFSLILLICFLSYKERKKGSYYCGLKTIGASRIFF